jgi:gliding motility-associated lipoprotein GldH
MVVIRNLLAVVFAIFFLASCDSSKHFDENLSLPGDAWPMDEALTFNVNIDDTVSTYRFFINVRNSTSYKYNNIYFFLTTTYPGGGMSRDTIECMLAARDGSWLGRGSGKYRDSRIPIRTQIRFPRKGEYVLRLNQAMREDILHGISEAGIRLEKE